METNRKLSALAYTTHYLPGFNLEALINSIPSETVSDRDKQVAIRFYLKVEALETIAVDWDISRERCRQIAQRVQNIAGTLVAKSVQVRDDGAAKDKQIKLLEWAVKQQEAKLKHFHQLTAPADLVEGIALEDIETSVRLYNILKGAKYDNIGKIKTLSRKEFFRIRNSGKTTFEELQQIMSTYSIKWPSE